MAYTKKQAIDQILIGVSSGQKADDVNVKAEDIEHRLIAEINRAVKEEVSGRNIEKFRKGRARMLTGDEVLLDSDLVCNFKITPVKDVGRDLMYLVLPAQMSNLNDNAGLKAVRPEAGNSNYPIIESQDILSGTEDWMDCPFAFYEKQGVNSEERIYLVNTSNVLGDHLVRYSVAASNVPDGTILPIPTGMEAAVIERCVQFFKGQRVEIPADYNANQRNMDYGRHSEDKSTY